MAFRFVAEPFIKRPAAQWVVLDIEDHALLPARNVDLERDPVVWAAVVLYPGWDWDGDALVEAVMEREMRRALSLTAVT